MTHVSFRDRGDAPFEGEVDYVVIGSGAGGAAAAVTLARGGAKVAIVDIAAGHGLPNNGRPARFKRGKPNRGF